MNKEFHTIFEDNAFDILEPRTGHLDRFEMRLRNPKKQKKTSYRWMAVAASVILIIGFGLGKMQQKNSFDLADISPKMEETQTFFVATISQELKEIEEARNPKTERIIEDALHQIEKLEERYKALIAELSEETKDKRIVFAMISNYQQRIDILQNVLHQIDTLNNPQQNENIFI